MTTHSLICACERCAVARRYGVPVIVDGVAHEPVSLGTVGVHLGMLAACVMDERARPGSLAVGGIVGGLLGLLIEREMARAKGGA